MNIALTAIDIAVIGGVVAFVAVCLALAVLGCWLWAKAISNTRGRDED